MSRRFPLPTHLPLLAAAVLITGCSVDPNPSPGGVAAPNVVRGYWYHDGNHSNNVVGPSPQAIYNATHGTWLWPPGSARQG
jgi:hypothetical protein